MKYVFWELDAPVSYDIQQEIYENNLPASEEISKSVSRPIREKVVDPIRDILREEINLLV